MRTFHLAALLFCAIHAHATTYWVATNGSNANPGTSVSPWLTVQKAATNAVAGDIVRVRAGVYDERVTPSASGTADNPIRFVGSGATVRGFDLSSRQFVHVIGFEITHDGTASYPYPAVLLSAAHSNLIYDVNIHEVGSYGIRIGSVNGNGNVIRANVIRNTGYLSGTNYDGAAGVYCFGTNNLIEYNDISRVSDFVSGRGYRNIVRNNYFHDVRSNYFTGTVPHVDGWESQPVDTNAANGMTWVVVERNLMVSNLVSHSHLALLQSTSMSTNDAGVNTGDAIFRLNVSSYLGSYLAVAGGFPRLRWYNNTVYKSSAVSDDGAFGGTFAVYGGSTNSRAWNNIYSTIGGGSTPVYLTDSSTAGNFIADNDLRYLTSAFGVTETNGVSGDPLFIDTTNVDFSISSNSPAVGAARAQASAVGAGVSSSTITVSDVRAFYDGWGIVSGDMIVIGTNAPVEVIGQDVNAETLTLASALSWADGDDVKLVATDDIGALPYTAAGFDITASITAPTGGNVGANVMVTVTTAVDAAVRFVKVFVDEIEAATIETAPWSTTVALPSDNAEHEITATAYAMYASSTPTSTASVTVNSSPAAAATAQAASATVGSIRAGQ